MTAAPRQIVVVDDEPDLRSLLGDYPNLQGFAEGIGISPRTGHEVAQWPGHDRGLEQPDRQARHRGGDRQHDPQRQRRQVGDAGPEFGPEPGPVAAQGGECRGRAGHRRPSAARVRAG